MELEMPGGRVKGFPEYGFRCPKCGGISAGIIWARVERSDQLHNWDVTEDDWVPGNNREVDADGGSGWRCPACDAVIENPNEGLVKLTITAKKVEVNKIE